MKRFTAFPNAIPPITEEENAKYFEEVLDRHPYYVSSAGVEEAMNAAFKKFGSCVIHVKNMDAGIIGGHCVIYAQSSHYLSFHDLVGYGYSTTEERITMAEAIIRATTSVSPKENWTTTPDNFPVLK